MAKIVVGIKSKTRGRCFIFVTDEEVVFTRETNWQIVRSQYLFKGLLRSKYTYTPLPSLSKNQRRGQGCVSYMILGGKAATRVAQIFLFIRCHFRGVLQKNIQLCYVLLQCNWIRQSSSTEMWVHTTTKVKSALIDACFLTNPVTRGSTILWCARELIRK